MQGPFAVGSLRTEVLLVRERVLVRGRVGKLEGPFVWVGEFSIYGVSWVLYPWLVLPGERYRLARRQMLAQYRLSRSCPDLGLRVRSGLFVLDWCVQSCRLDCPGGFLPARERRLLPNRPSLCLACQDLLVHLGHSVGALLLWVGPPLLCLTHRRG